MKTIKQLKKQYSSKDKMFLLLYSLICIIILTFSVGYSLLNQNLSISGEAAYRVIADMRITDLSKPTRINGGDIIYNGTYGVNSLSLHVELPNKDSSISYEVEMTNIGNINQWVKSIDATSNNENIVYKIDGLAPLEDIIYSPNISNDNIKIFTITFSYKDSIKNGVDTLPTGDGTKLSTIISFEYEILDTYLITYDLGGGTVTSNPTNYTKADTIILNNPTKKGYDFLGWTGSNGTVPQKTITIEKLSERDRHYIANWKALEWTFTVMATPTNATITLSDGEQTITENGSASIVVEADEEFSWSVTLDHYVTQSGNEKILEDMTKNIVLISTWNEWSVEKGATCTETGIEARTCSVCGTKETNILPALGHSYTTNKVASTLLSRGYSLHTCSRCGNSYSDSFDTSLPVVNGGTVTYTSAAWSGGIVNKVSAGGITTSNTVGGKFSSGNPVLYIENSSDYYSVGVFYIKVNLDNVQSITIDSDLWDTGYSTSPYRYGYGQVTIGLTASQPTSQPDNASSIPYIYGKTISTDILRSETSSLKATDTTLYTSELSGIHYITIYLKHTMREICNKYSLGWDVCRSYGAYLRFNKLILNY